MMVLLMKINSLNVWNILIRSLDHVTLVINFFSCQKQLKLTYMNYCCNHRNYFILIDINTNNFILPDDYLSSIIIIIVHTIIFF